ncbi:hypothetical protein CEXT_696201 [Caerostris extrusa]|uniref:Uncharacterized protein n=1 Tax=Caerostris extrusa TaxID=172846 RepID=A0AAV4XFP9_CAEEX|nr:hypothetical protein CEXT_696201 [Caerostris extrusa]
MKKNSIIRLEIYGRAPGWRFSDKMFMMFPVNRAAFFKIGRALKGSSGALFLIWARIIKIQVAALNVRPHKEGGILPGGKRCTDWKIGSSATMKGRP